MPTTPNLSLPYLEAGQAQKHVTLNESLRLLDAVTQLAVAAVSASPPPEPDEGERHIVDTAPTGAFSAHANEVAAFQDGAWVFLSPRPGWRAWNADTEELLIWSGAAWTALSGGGAGDVTGPAGATDRAIARFDGTTGKLLADSPATVDDNGVISAPRTVSGGTETTPIVGLLTEDGAGVGPIVDLERASASPADGDSLGRLNFSGRDSGGNKTDYANITAQIVETDDGNESGQIYLQTLIDGVLTTVLRLGKNLFGVFTAGDIGDGHLVVGDGGGKGVKGHASGAPGTAAFKNTGTSGDAVPVLNADATFSTASGELSLKVQGDDGEGFAIRSGHAGDDVVDLVTERPVAQYIANTSELALFIGSSTRLYAGGVEQVRLQGNDYMFGGTTQPAGSANSLVLFNGTAPSGSVANGVALYSEDVSASAELKVRDEAGNVTTLSPHNFEMFTPDVSDPFPWSYYSRNDYLGEEINVDMSGAIMALEQLTGEKFIHRRSFTPRDMVADKAEFAARDLANRIEAATREFVEATRDEAIEIVARDGQSVLRLKAGVLQDTAGKFYRCRTRAEAETLVKPKAIKEMPRWMRERLNRKQKGR